MNKEAKVAGGSSPPLPSLSALSAMAAGVLSSHVPNPEGGERERKKYRGASKYDIRTEKGLGVKKIRNTPNLRTRSYRFG